MIYPCRKCLTEYQMNKKINKIETDKIEIEQRGCPPYARFIVIGLAILVIILIFTIT